MITKLLIKGLENKKVIKTLRNYIKIWLYF